MPVKEAQLLHCMRHALNRAMEATEPHERETLLDATNQLVTELLLHTDRDFYLDAYHQGKILAAEGLAHLQNLDIDHSAIIVEFDDLRDELSKSIKHDLVLEHLEKLMGLLLKVVSLLPSTDGSINQYLDNLNAWEAKLYARHLEPAPEPAKDILTDPVINGELFQSYLKEKFPQWTGLEVKRFFPIAGGFTKKTILVETRDNVNGPQSLVIRAQQSTVILKQLAERITDEYPIVRLAWDAGCQVAEPLWLEDDAAKLGRHFMVSRKAEGRSIGTPGGASEAISEAMLKNLVENLVKVHHVDLDHFSDRITPTTLGHWYQFKTIRENTRETIKYFRQMAEDSEVIFTPLIERGVRWLEDNIPDCDEPPALAHGDYGLHNVMVDNDKVTAILDWECSRIIDPAYDLSWFLTLNEQYVKRDKLLQLYRQAGGRDVSDYRLRYFDVYHCLMLPLGCKKSLQLLDRRYDNIQYAMLGLRYMHSNASRLSDTIKAAEAAR